MMADSDSDKKRNKLGYQRISIACGHCRRRKIRCLVAEGDPQNRCQNCIRLKKECYFYPVDQQAPAENRSQASAATNNTESIPSSAVSPPASEGLSRSFEAPQEIASYPAVPSNAPTLYQPIPGPIPNSNALPSQGTISPTEYIYQPQAESHHPWPPNDQYMGRSASAMDATMGHRAAPTLQYQEHNPGGDFAPFPTQQATVGANPETIQTASYQPWPDPQWQHAQQPLNQPMRSMSYSHAEGMSGSYTPHPYDLPPDPRQQPSPMAYHTATPDTQNVPSPMPPTHASEPSIPQMQQQLMYDQHPHFVYPQGSGPAVGNAPLQAHPAYGHNWYAESSPFVHAQQEQINPALENRGRAQGRMRRRG